MSGTASGKLRLVLADQLSHDLASLRDIDPEKDVILMAEVRTEATYVKHHKRKTAFLFSAMRHFAQELEQRGLTVRYIRYDDAQNAGSLEGEVRQALNVLGLKHLVLTFPGEWRVLEDMQSWGETFCVHVEIREDDRFLSTLEDFDAWTQGRKQLRMEFFYRELRKRLNILMEAGSESDEKGAAKPLGGQWNFDADNRKALPKGVSVPAKTAFEPDAITEEVLALVRAEFHEHFGSVESFDLAVTRDQALQVLAQFIEERLMHFGDFQDAMKKGEPWLFHSHISFYLNCGLLTPAEVIEQVESAYHAHNLPLNAVEGFIRQVLGWREYVRGLYWQQMPHYAEQNTLDATRDLPEFFWTADTDMQCLSQCISETRDNAYAHHIQRLMVLGNFLLLAGIDPKQVQNWYLLVYADAYEWVELPNVQGMILFADGGLMASKPYAASGSYINKMSDYCQSCRYKVKDKNGDQACPFNYLYWDFLERNKPVLRGNQRLAMPYRTLEKMTDEKRALIASDSQRFLGKLTANEKV
ncbi:deoxyribodipyrimidine photolyase [Oleiphilus sp. HI0071]|uniref:cryptochrome/photolyase family protein n=1 Tax=Oleiphilus sp. HI0080 TaxID=1822255 RepID=UPI0007C2313B|nr:cryptochrome/photolyase family protein [Oleiphilus sp. HI0080]KZY64667.1 deoxyribodipyrimidine photolyase [Oleiphilus sp. HI0065]KZY85020.1 deoxyribodipyrimidine photolyase [Oleiphilus sp. HI0071]KZZ04981.1 deoxyribodipyrimidine photolyase [Oleiphilus sp. HI0073]KZZ55066.1 deoxyribodipyrimidine photolyase [Oleiphilus sp. HI0122]KZZ67115.1 deoxyribodipyrimidine photolyase [Oleiphilus sp. HI0130]